MCSDRKDLTAYQKNLHRETQQGKGYKYTFNISTSTTGNAIETLKYETVASEAPQQHLLLGKL